MLNNNTYKPILIWLFVGISMVFIQVIIGGITRLTDSGLSITEWKVVEGTLPPLNQEAWNTTFDNYKLHAKKQYESLHPNMTLSQFKLIYFWEYFHRLWARMMAIVFIIGFGLFLALKKIPNKLLLQLLVVITLASLEGLFGWIMVASGLNEDNRTWVSAYKLVIHLTIATLLFSYLCWTFFSHSAKKNTSRRIKVRTSRAAWLILPVLLIQIILGGFMAGMRAGIVLPHFPSWLYLDKISLALQQPFVWNTANLVNYEPSSFIKMFVQILHRSTALILSIQIIWLTFLIKKEPLSKPLKTGSIYLLVLFLIQFLLGVFTVMGCLSKTPVVLGVLHQATALLLLASLLFVLFQIRKNHQPVQ
jgi:cytochrome c oxidase assembly protein subunit 15